jgi:hypothetical protein
MPQGCRLRAVAEQLLPRAQVYREDEQPVLIDEVVVDERPRERTAAVYL